MDEPIFSGPIPDDIFLPLDKDLTHEDIVHLSRKRGGNMFSRDKMDRLNVSFEGDVYSGDVNWFFVYGSDEHLLKASPSSRVYKICMFTPFCKVLRPHRSKSPYGEPQVSDIKTPAIDLAKDFAERRVDPSQFEWY